MSDFEFYSVGFSPNYPIRTNRLGDQASVLDQKKNSSFNFPVSETEINTQQMRSGFRWD